MATYYVATTGNDTTGDGSSGNPYATPGKASGVATTAGDIIYVKEGSYTFTSSTANVAGGKVLLTAGVRMEGYKTTIGDQLGRPVFHAGSLTSLTMVSMNDSVGTSQCSVSNLEVDGDSQSSIVGFGTAATYHDYAYRCFARRCTTGFSNRCAVLCASISCTTGFSAGAGAFTACYTYGGTTSFVAPYTFGCIADSPSGKGFTPSYASMSAHCCVRNPGGIGYDPDYDNLNSLYNFVVYGGSSYGLAGANGTYVGIAAGGNSSGTWQTTPGYLPVAVVSLSADPWADAANANTKTTIEEIFACFLPNSTAGGGAALRAAGFPSYADLGAVRHQDAGEAGIKAPLIGPGQLVRN